MGLANQPHHHFKVSLDSDAVKKVNLLQKIPLTFAETTFQKVLGFSVHSGSFLELRSQVFGFRRMVNRRANVALHKWGNYLPYPETTNFVEKPPIERLYRDRLPETIRVSGSFFFAQTGEILGG